MERTARVVGEDWARARVAQLGSEGRSAAGGWPGTITEARSRVRSLVASELARERFQPAAVEEVDRAARAAYSRARAVWATLAKADESEEGPSESVEGTNRGGEQRKGQGAR